MSVIFTRGVRFAALLLSIMAFTPADAATLYWDTNGDTIYSGNTGGVWGTDAFWSSDARGLSATGAYVSGSAVAFAAGIDGKGTYSVTLGANQTATGLDFRAGHVTLAPATLPTLADSSGVQTLTLSGTGPTVNVQNMDSVITSRISSSGLTKTGVGRLTLNYGASSITSYFNLGGVININGGTLEYTGTGNGANQLTASINVNSGGTFYWSGGVNNVSDGALITVNTGGILNTRANDQIGTIAGNGLILFQGGTIALSMGNNVTVFSGVMAGSGILRANNGNGSLTLTNANTFSGTITGNSPNTSTGGIRLGHVRAAQNASISLVNTTVTAINLSFASGIGSFIVGSLEGTSNLLLQDVSGAGIALQVGNNDASKTYSGVLSGAGGLTKIGTGTLTLTGATSGANTYTGDTTVNGGAHNATNAPNGSVTQATAGALKLDFTPVTSPTSNIINSASRLVLGGGKLWVAGRNDSTGVSQTFNNTLLNASRSYVTVTLGTLNGGAVVNLGAITRVAGGLLEFTLAPVTQSLTNGITTTTANDVSGILGGWAIVGNEWAVKSTTGTAIGNVVAADAGVYTTYAAGDIVSSTTSNLLINDASTTITTAAGVTDVNTIMVRNNIADNSVVARTLDIGAGETLRLGVTGSIWNQSGTNGSLNIGTANNVGTLTAGGASNTAGEIILNNSGFDVTIKSTIANNGTGAVTLVKTGTGQLILSGTNTFTGGSVFTQGRSRADTTTALGTGAATVVAGATLWLNAGGTYANDFYLAGSGYGEGAIPGAIRLSSSNTLGTSSSTITLTGDARIGAVNTGATNFNTLAGKITGNYGLDLAGGAAGSNIIVLANSNNDFTGNLSLNTNLNGSTAYNSTTVTVRLGASEVIPNGLGKGDVILSGGSTANIPVVLDLYGYNETINSLVSYGTHANTFVTNGRTGTTSTLTIGDNNSSTLVSASSNALYTTFFGGALVDGSGVIALTKIGEGTQTFTGANTYSGATLISKGILQAGATNTLSANSDVTIANDPTAMLALTSSQADYSQTIKSLSGGGTVNLGTIAAADTVATPGTRLTTGSTADTTYSGTIVGAGGLVKQGTGKFTLTGANTYVGTTQVTAGNLQVGQAGAGQSGTGAVVVSSGATLSGSGAVQGATVINGLLSAGDNGGASIGRLTFTDASTGSLTLAGGGSSVAPRVLFTLAGATGNEANPTDGIQTAGLLNGSFGNHDALVVQGTLTLAAGSTIKVELGSGYNPGFGDVYNLIDWGTVNGGAAAIVAGGFNAANVGGDLDLQLGAAMIANGWYWNTDQFLTDGIIFVVPEPGRALLLMMGLGMCALRRRRR